MWINLRGGYSEWRFEFLNICFDLIFSCESSEGTYMCRIWNVRTKGPHRKIKPPMPFNAKGQM